MRRFVLFFSAVTFALFSMACDQHATFERASRTGTLPATVTDGSGVVSSALSREAWIQHATLANPKVDLLFVIDTSQSMIEEIAAVKNALESFAQTQIDRGIDLCAAVLKAEAFSGQDGKITSAINDKSQYKVVCLKNLSKFNFLYYLGENLSVPLVSSLGEAGLYAFKESFSNPTIFKQNKSYGFFRDDATLAVLFISDENDISTSPTPTNPNLSCFKFNYLFSPNGPSTYEDTSTCAESNVRATFYSKLNPQTGVYELIWGPQEVLSAALKFQGSLPFYAGVVGYQYSPSFVESSQNQIAYGYNEFVTLAGGDHVDMSLVFNSKTFKEAFVNFGKQIATTASLQTTFDLSAPACEKTIRIFVDNKELSDFIILNNTRVRIRNARDAGQEGSNITIEYQAKKTGC